MDRIKSVAHAIDTDQLDRVYIEVKRKDDARWGERALVFVMTITDDGGWQCTGLQPGELEYKKAANWLDREKITSVTNPNTPAATAESAKADEGVRYIHRTADLISSFADRLYKSGVQPDCHRQLILDFANAQFRSRIIGA